MITLKNGFQYLFLMEAVGWAGLGLWFGPCQYMAEGFCYSQLHFSSIAVGEWACTKKVILFSDIDTLKKFQPSCE